MKNKGPIYVCRCACRSVTLADSGDYKSKYIWKIAYLHFKNFFYVFMDTKSLKSVETFKISRGVVEP